MQCVNNEVISVLLNYCIETKWLLFGSTVKHDDQISCFNVIGVV